MQSCEAHVALAKQLCANRREQRLINGQIVEVISVADTGTTTLSDGRILPPDYRLFTHGYAVTSHASQGKTVDEVLLPASSRSFGAVSREQFYVSISRGRQRCRIFTDDKELLRERITRSGSRKAALELAGLEASLAKQGFTRKTADVETPSLSIPAQQPRTVSRALRPLRPIPLSQRLARSFMVWAAHVKHAVFDRAAASHATLPGTATRQGRGAGGGTATHLGGPSASRLPHGDGAAEAGRDGDQRQTGAAALAPGGAPGAAPAAQSERGSGTARTARSG